MEPCSHLGPQGTSGATGFFGGGGFQGLFGQRGKRGDRGDRGERGRRGHECCHKQAGPQGFAGSDSVKNSNEGTQGPQGLTGTPSSEPGAQGPPGMLEGPQGAAGSDSKNGLVGTDGPQGDAGNKGDMGLVGQKGHLGHQGGFGFQGSVPTSVLSSRAYIQLGASAGSTAVANGTWAPLTLAIADPWLVPETNLFSTVSQDGANTCTTKYFGVPNITVAIRCIAFVSLVNQTALTQFQIYATGTSDDNNATASTPVYIAQRQNVGTGSLLFVLEGVATLAQGQFAEWFVNIPDTATLDFQYASFTVEQIS